MKKILLRIYTCTLLSKERANYYQKIARDAEWDAVVNYIRPGKFLDVGAGAGYAMERAQNDCNCDVYGIDPEPGEHGVGRTGSNYLVAAKVSFGVAEDIPFADTSFDIVYSSHVLEHVNNAQKALQEMQRVVTNDGIIIIGVPTATMSLISWFSQILFTSHIRFVNIVFSKFINTENTRWWELFIPASHSKSNKTIIHDIKNYRITKWHKTISQELTIITTLQPCLYPYPQYRQLFTIKKKCGISSSVFFICKKNI